MPKMIVSIDGVVIKEVQLTKIARRWAGGPITTW